MNKIGVLAAIILAALILIIGGSSGIFFVAAMVWFLILSAFVTVIGKKRKKKLKLYQEARSWKNVVANGIVPLAAVVLFAIDLRLDFINPSILIVAYVASIAAVTADKFASEIGVLGDSRPVMLVTLGQTKVGVSGGITSLGIFAGIIGSLLESMVLINFGNFPFYMAVVIISGLFGNIVDSVFGYYEERGYGNKFTSNALCALSGLLLSIVLLVML